MITRPSADALGEEPAGRDWTHVATWPKRTSDGVDVEVDCAAWPARFYRLRFGAHVLATGAGVTLESGRSMAQLTVDMADAIASGCLAVRTPEPPPVGVAFPAGPMWHGLSG